MPYPPVPKALPLKSAAYVLVVLALASCGGPKRMLQFKVYPEDSFVVYETSNGELTLTGADGMSNTVRSEREVLYLFDVTSVDDSGNIDFSVKIQKARYSLFIQPLGEALVGKSFSMRMAPDGRVTALWGTDALREQVAEDLTIGQSAGGPEQAEMLRNRMMAHVEDDALRGKLEIIFRVWPPTPVAPGDRWSREDIVLPHDSVVDSAQLTLTSWEGGEAVISIDSRVRSTGTDPSKDVSGTITGQAILDAVSGFPKSLSFERHLEGTVKPLEGGPTSIKAREEVFVELLRL